MSVGEPDPLTPEETEGVRSTLLQAFSAYEKALMDNDVETMNEFFSTRVPIVRFGIVEEQWGTQELKAWRATAPPVPAGRTLASTQVAVFGRQSAVVTTLFRYPGRATLGRQTQVWVNDAGGDPLQVDSWRIVSAHVSERDVCERDNFEQDAAERDSSDRNSSDREGRA